MLSRGLHTLRYLLEFFSPQKGPSSTGSLFQWLSLFLLLFLPLAVVATALLLALGHLRLSQQMHAVQSQEKAQIQAAAQVLADDIETVTSDLMVVAHTPSMALYLEESTEVNRSRVAELFRSVSNEKRIYAQLRYIDSDGEELIRVNHNENGSVIVPDNELQSKGGRYYFQDMLRLKAGEIYISPLDLNVEHHQVERPYKPVLRIGTPVFNRAGVKRGVVILNMYGSELLSDFRRAMADKHHAMLLNRDGYWLSHFDSAKEWGFMLDRKVSFANSYSDVWQRIRQSKEGSFISHDGLFTFTTVYPLQHRQHSSIGARAIENGATPALQAEDYFWKVVSLVPEKDLPIGYRWWAQNYLPELLFSLVVLVLFSAVVSRSLLNRRLWQQTVFENETRLREITATLGEGVYVLDEQGLVSFINPEAERLLGWGENELIGMNGHNTFHHHTPEGKPHAVEACPVHQTIKTGKLYRSLNDWFIRKDGTVLPVSIVSTPILRNGAVVGSVAAFQDITPHLEAERTLREAEALFRSALENAPIGMAIVSLDGHFAKVNRVLCQLLGFDHHELEMLTFAEITHPDDLDADLGNVRRLRNDEIDAYQMEKRYIRKDGKVVWAQLNVSVMRGNERQPLYFLAQIEDITERKEHQDQIHQLAFYDTLTGLPNRRLFLDHFDQALTQAKRHQRSMAVMFLDLDHFKQVNDTLGHEAGDELLQIVAGRLASEVRHGDTVSRLGGDEFVIVLAEIAHPEDAAQVAGKIIDTLRAPIAVKGEMVTIGVSIGIAIYPVAGTDDIHELMRKADNAMYAAKHGGRNQYYFANPGEKAYG